MGFAWWRQSEICCSAPQGASSRLALQALRPDSEAAQTGGYIGSNRDWRKSILVGPSLRMAHSASACAVMGLAK